MRVRMSGMFTFFIDLSNPQRIITFYTVYRSPSGHNTSILNKLISSLSKYLSSCVLNVLLSVVFAEHNFPIVYVRIVHKKKSIANKTSIFSRIDSIQRELREGVIATVTYPHITQL